MTGMSSDSKQQYDVAIIGAGYEGGLLGAILAYKGVKVLMVDNSIHPRFALGESTVRHTFRLMKIIGERFGVPEIKDKFSSASGLHTSVAASCGEKRNFGFIYHREGQHQNPTEATQLVIPPFREGYEAHLFRQDIDSFLTYTAVRYGATVKYRTSVNNVEIDGSGVRLGTAAGEEFRARYVVDASGSFGVLSRALNLRDNPPRLKLNTRCLFTHMIDVKEYDDLVLPNGVPRYPERWYNGTCHHIFDGGWLWVIPFNNRKGSTNQLVSVGLSYDNIRFPKPKDMTPEQEWASFLSKYPSINEQFKDAKPVRDWISSDRLQTSSKQSVGDRWCLTAAAHGSGFIDALFSRGLASSTEVLNALASRLLKAVKDDDFSREKFEYLERVEEANMRINDRLTSTSYACFRSFETWNAWYRIWALGVGLGDLRLTSAYRKYKKSHDESVLPDAEEPMGLFFSQHAGYGELFESCAQQVDAMIAGSATTQQTADEIFRRMRECKFAPPSLKLGDPNAKFINQGTIPAIFQTLKWLMTSAPPEIKEMSMGIMADINPMSPHSRWRTKPALT